MRVDQDRSSIAFIRPFLFPSHEVDAILDTLRNAQVTGREWPIRVWQSKELDTRDWLSHIAESLKPQRGGPAIVECFEATNQFFESERGLKASLPFEFVPRDKKQSPFPLKLELLQLVLFRNGLGFVIQRWKIQSGDPAAWLDLQHFGRFSQLDRGGKLRLTSKPEQSPRSFPDPHGRYANESPIRDEGTFADLDAIVFDSGQLGEQQRFETENVFIAGRSIPYGR